MCIVARRTKGGVVYWACNRLAGKNVWERVGPDKREAQRRDAAMKREIKAGQYGGRHTGAVTVAREAGEFFRHRDVRTIADEERNWELHVVGRAPWFAALRLDDVRPSHTARLVDDLEKPYPGEDGAPRTLAPKTIANIIGLLHTMFTDALLHDRIHANPIVVKRGRLKRNTSIHRVPYSVEDMRKILLCDAPVDARMWIALAFYTGMREGEVCGLQWGDWDPGSLPLGCLSVRRQYDGAPLKTDRPRMVPVHSGLARILAWWRATGWELVHLRPPRPEDPIVPSRVLAGPHSRSSAYKMWLRVLQCAGVQNISLHATRHTFITLARRGGARREVIERVTHNAAGDIVDLYTHWDWAPLCEAVAYFPSLLSDSESDQFTKMT